MTRTLPRPALRVGAAVLLALAAAAPARGQRTSISVGETVSGALDALDPELASGIRFEVFEFEGRAGERVTATLRSSEFDAMLRLARTVAGITDELESDDDGGGETDARVRGTLPVDGTYLLIAQSYGEGERGAFTLTLAATPEPTTAVPQPLAVGQSTNGALTETDALEEDDDTYYDVWTVDARAGQRLVALMESGSFDAYLRFGRVDADGMFEELEFDDDGGGGTDARLRVRVPYTGAYELRATSIGPDTGAYRLSLSEGPPPAETASRQPVRAGAPVGGTLSDTDAVRDDDEQYYDYWLYEGRAGERITVDVRAAGFDAYVSVGRLDGETFIEIDSNDDGPDGTDAQLDLTLPANGTYAIRATSLGGGEVGDYTVQVTRR